MAQSGGYQIKQHAQAGGALDMVKSSMEELTLAKVYTRKQCQINLKNGYHSDDDDSDEDEEDGKLLSEKKYHDNGNPMLFKTYQKFPPARGYPGYERLIEEKHFDPSGVCRVDIHFGLGQPYMSRKHFHPNQRLKSEQLFFVEDERTMKARKAGHWRTYYENGSIKSEMQYDVNGIRTGFNKRYAEDGTVEWVKDYTKEYCDRIQEFNSRRGKVDLTTADAARLLGFEDGSLPPNVEAVNRAYRKCCAPLHPDKSPDPDTTQKFIEVSRAREVLLKHYADLDDN